MKIEKSDNYNYNWRISGLRIDGLTSFQKQIHQFANSSIRNPPILIF